MIRVVPLCTVAFILIISAFYFEVSAQATEDAFSLEKLKTELTTATTDTARIWICRRIADIYQDTATQRAIQYEQQALDIAEKSGLQKHRHIGFMRVATFYFTVADYNKARSYLWRCDPARLGNLNLEHTYHRTNGIVMMRCAQNDSARIHYEKALQSSKELKDFYLQARVTNDIGNLLTNEQRFSESFSYFLEALEGFKKIDYKEGISIVLGNLALTHLRACNFQQGIDYALEGKAVAQKINKVSNIAFALKVASLCYQNSNQYEKALQAAREAIVLYEKLGYKDKLEELYNGLGKTLLSLGKKVEAKEAFLKSLNTLRGEITRAKSGAYNSVGKIYADENQFEKGLQYLDSALQIATKLKLMDMARQSHSSFSDVYSKAGKHDLAYRHLKQFISLKDSSIRMEKREEVEAIEARYKTQLKEESIRNLQAENKVKDLQLYLLGLIAVVIAIVALFMCLRHHNNLKIRRQLQDLDKLKSQFFVNISHEYRTPLSLIMAPLRRHLESDANKDDKQEFAMMYKNAERLSTLTNQVLELAKLESGSSKLQVRHTDISALLNITYSYFRANANDNHIRYEFIKPDFPMMGWMDSDKIEQVVCNLLSNAFNFTPADGSITLKASVMQDQLTIEVHDSGIGIPATQTSLIFNRFYQVAESATRTTQGSGIGLTVCKEIIDLHRGTIAVTSREGAGSTFTIILSVGKDHYKTDEIAIDSMEKPRKVFTSERYDLPSPIELSIDNHNESHPLLLIVEDNRDMSAFLCKLLGESYRVITASNGAEGWKQASEFIPDIIISDIMMPEMDGIEMCRKIRMHEMTSHIPLIMLTARTDQVSRIEGLTTGADVYLAKPFDTQELFINIHNLLRHRLDIQKFIMKQVPYDAEPPQIELPEADKIFIEKLDSIMEHHYGNEKFDVDEFAEEVGMSRTQFYRKVKALTGLSPGELIRDFRLAIACTLLQQQGIHVNEVCYKVGFSSVSNFIKIFKNHTGGYTPGEYKTMQAQKAKSIGVEMAN